MNKSMDPFKELLIQLTRRARSLQLSDSQWATRAHVRKETLSRLRSRRSCDFGTLQALSAAVGATLSITEKSPTDVLDISFPAEMGRADEERLVDLCAAPGIELKSWRQLGPPYFMSGLAVMLASVQGFDRRTYLELGETLYAGASTVDVFAQWLARTPTRPSRFIPMVLASRRAA